MPRSGAVKCSCVPMHAAGIAVRAVGRDEARGTRGRRAGGRGSHTHGAEERESGHRFLPFTEVSAVKWPCMGELNIYLLSSLQAQSDRDALYTSP